MQSKKCKEVLIISEMPDLVDSFIDAVNDTPYYQTSNLSFVTTFSHNTKAIIYLYTDESSYEHIQEKTSLSTIPGFIIQISDIGTTPIVRPRSSYASIKHSDPYFHVDLNSKISLEHALMQISHGLETAYKLLNIKLTHKGMKILKICSFVFSILSALLSLFLIFTGGILAISRYSVEKRWFAHSLLTSGNLTFVMSFVGFYGVKKSGVKEYLKIYALVLVINSAYKIVLLVGLKIYALVLVINSAYKIVLLVGYVCMKWSPEIHQIIIPEMCTCIIFELLTAFIICLELSAVKTTLSSSHILSIND
ncbi:hypothetical protein SteCoe_4867 [Stentor coeruleus]|uniref:Uncharacterized protein n=1 Tax=Stentor coeruleus TaxID=5963 RepID=A0A1R2CTQ9_9CILI|nr:hypothetical protein SteCoe_4867 [Stentor coeruleus]